nr:hypothetical protein [Tanacetum cinerariifolium]
MALIPYSNIWSYPKVVSPHSGRGRLTNRRYPGVRDTVQLETTINTISHEYLLDFTSEYGIPSTLHPALPGPKDRIVDFPKGKIGVYTRTNCRLLTADMDLFNLIRAPNPTKVKTGSRPRAPHEVPLLTLTTPRVIEMDEPAATDSSATAAPGARQAEETAPMDPLAALESRKKGRDGPDVNAPLKSLRKDHADPRPSGSSHGGKSLIAIQLGLASTVVVSEDAPVGVSDPDPLFFADDPSRHPVDVAQSSPGIAVARDPESENASSPAEYNVNLARHVATGSQLCLRFEQEAKLLRKPVAQVARRDKRIQARELEIRNLEASLEAEANAKRTAEDKSAGLSQELERMHAQFLDLKVSNERLSQQVATLQQQVSGEEKLKAAFEEFKRQQDERVEQWSIAGRRWVIGRGLRLAVMKCSESLELRQAFADVVSAGIAKRLSEGLRHGLEHGQAQRSLESIEAYEPKAEAKFVAALQALKDLKIYATSVPAPFSSLSQYIQRCVTPGTLGHARKRLIGGCYCGKH